MKYILTVEAFADHIAKPILKRLKTSKQKKKAATISGAALIGLAFKFKKDKEKRMEKAAEIKKKKSQEKKLKKIKKQSKDDD